MKESCKKTVQNPGAIYATVEFHPGVTRFMSLDNVPAGKNLPDAFNVVIEIPMNADPVKYEVDKATGAIFVDRFMSTAMHYPTNYGYVPQTISGDGDPVDVLVITPVRRLRHSKMPLMIAQMPRTEVPSVPSLRLERQIKVVLM